MPKYVGYLPTYCFVKYVLETDELIPENELYQRFSDEAQCDGSVCVGNVQMILSWAN